MVKVTVRVAGGDYHYLQEWLGYLWGVVRVFLGVGGSGQNICRCILKWSDHLQE